MRREFEVKVYKCRRGFEPLRGVAGRDAREGVATANVRTQEAIQVLAVCLFAVAGRDA